MCQYLTYRSFVEYSEEKEINLRVKKAELILGVAFTHMGGLVGALLFVKEYLLTALQLPVLLRLTQNAQTAHSTMTICKVRT